MLEKGGCTDWHQVQIQLFLAIDHLLCPNNKSDSYRKDPNSTKKLLRGDATWKTCKQTLGWLVETLQHYITLTFYRLEKVLYDMEDKPT